ncbi:MAG: dockerin type I domain-containing protein [Pirellulaceae bacterium]|nr:dockerin type I domain-containing protein [Pirellulaceae bacterium]
MTAGHAAHWNSVIEAVAAVFPGSLGYAADWDETTNANLTEAIWENPHIDFIGVDLYTPLATAAQADASGEYPDAAFIEIVQANWERACHDLRDFAAARKSGRGMPVVLTEVGVTPYNRGSTEPWSSRFQEPESAEQANVFDALLRATDETGAWLPEFYAWHWPMDGAAGSKFLIHPEDPLSGPTAQLLQEHVLMEREDFGFHRFTVTYTDSLGIDLRSLDNADILVTGPNGYAQSATLVQASSGPDGTPRCATYRIAAPEGVWDATDYGMYHVLVQPDQVFNLQGNPVPAGAIASFQFDPAPWEYRPNRSDVDASGFVAPLDVLRLINEINRSGSRRLPPPPSWQESPPPYFDVNGDNWLTPADVLAVINEINSRSNAAGEAEAAGAFGSQFGAAKKGRADLWSAAT